jgi:ribose 5-phosphate isomerase B
MKPDELRARVRKVVYRTLGRAEPSAARPGSGAPAEASETRPRSRLLTERDVRDLPVGSELEVEASRIITPLARQVAMERRVKLVPHQGGASPGAKAEPRPSPPAATAASRPSSPRPSVGEAVAIGADHGGYPLKEVLKKLLAELGHDVIDCGTNSTDSVDYPDFALAVAELVAQGRVGRGILVDGAGIGSCMAANKVPGVRAAMCYDEATALNSREHNDANVLTLGAGFLGESLARQVVQTWLATPFGGGRHGRRVDKIMAIERRFTRQR